MDHHLEGVVICITGDPRFDEDNNKHIRDQFTDENVSRWLKYRGGELVEEVTKATTHLICSRAAYRKKGNSKIKAARKYKCEIVTYEWLTDTFQLWDFQKKKPPPTSLYHPGKPRDGDAISNLFKKSEKKAKAVKKQETPAAADSTAMDAEECAGAPEEAAEIGMEQLAISEEKVSQKNSEESDPAKVSETGDGKATKVADDMKGASTPVDKESGKPAGKPEKSAKVKKHEPLVDLSLYTICKDEVGVHQIEVWKPDGQGNERGSRWVLQLYESKSEPKTYLFGAKKYPTPNSSACIRRFPSKTPGDKKHELREFRVFFYEHTGVIWRQRDELPSKGPYYYLSSAAVRKTVGSASHKSTPDKPGGKKKGNPTSSVAVPCERDGDDETSLKRKSSVSSGRPAKAFKVTKPLVTSNSNKVTDGGSKNP